MTLQSPVYKTGEYVNPFVRNLNVSLVRDGVILGVLLFEIFAAATIGLETVCANQASFIFGLNMVFVTVFELLFRKRLSIRAVLAVILAFTGIGVMSWKSGELAIAPEKFAVAVTPYFASLLNPKDPLCPLRLQVIPRSE
ncbi:hypothetical protein [Tolypothrix sp. VBCCA 56010]|uniref:hypothetical protein n=1 Tax=Tolypothrix sp. VBCCA 56010 TaxID=3137731 RepID=UPI003D7CEF07